jgi:transcriptional regulator with XRE-family HTH domain
MRKPKERLSGAVLKAARTLAGLSQRQLADAAGLHPKSVAYWERKGSSGHWGEVGLKRIVDALRAHGVIVECGPSEGARRVPAFSPNTEAGSQNAAHQ